MLNTLFGTPKSAVPLTKQFWEREIQNWRVRKLQRHWGGDAEDHLHATRFKRKQASDAKYLLSFSGGLIEWLIGLLAGHSCEASGVEIGVGKKICHS